MQTNILAATFVAMAAGLVGAADPALATMLRAPVASSTATVLVEDQSDAQRFKQEQMQRQQLMQREKAEMRHEMIKREEQKIIGTAKRYLHEYERSSAGAAGGNR